ncbi:MAG: ribosome-associated translation inhibitor RaiA [Propionibacteriales bacterium]|nr:ribosome-associated translation inhibitor RaiA [Propionibacteriales bacterium]
MDVVVKGRHCEVSDRYRQHVEEKVARLEKYDQKLFRVEVEISQERNPRMADKAVRVELTLRSRGPVMRAEAAAEDKMTALDVALDRLQTRLRKAADRRRIHHGTRTPVSVSQALAAVGAERGSLNGTGPDLFGGADESGDHMAGPISVTGDGPLVVREKSHTAAPMTLDQALYEMELVGHDFFLFVDKESELPSVVYRRRGYDYGVIRLSV